jgi:hypothetical protein
MGLQYIANLEPGLNVRNALNSMFTELYGTINPPFKYIDANQNFSQSISANVMVTNISITNISASPTLRIGITPNGQEILSDTVITNFILVNAQQYFLASGTVYFTWTSGNFTGIVNIRMDVINNYN